MIPAHSARGWNSDQCDDPEVKPQATNLTKPHHGLEEYRPGQSVPIFVGGKKQLKPVLRLMSAYRLVIEEIEDGKLISSYTRWVDAVHTNGTDNPGVYLTFSSRFKRIWLEAKKRLLEQVAQNPPTLDC